MLADHPDNAAAWNGIGLVLMELHRYADAKNAFARAVDAAPAYASAHYNLSFTLSQLGDFDGALRATKRALELEPYYIQQKFQLSIDLQYEDPLISIVPEISADVTAADLGDAFVFDSSVLEGIFDDLAPPAAVAPVTPAAEEAALALARDYISKGLLELASAELTRANLALQIEISQRKQAEAERLQALARLVDAQEGEHPSFAPGKPTLVMPVRTGTLPPMNAARPAVHDCWP